MEITRLRAPWVPALRLQPGPLPGWGHGAMEPEDEETVGFKEARGFKEEGEILSGAEQALILSPRAREKPGGPHGSSVPGLPSKTNQQNE